MTHKSWKLSLAIFCLTSAAFASPFTWSSTDIPICLAYGNGAKVQNGKIAPLLYACIKHNACSQVAMQKNSPFNQVATCANNLQQSAYLAQQLTAINHSPSVGAANAHTAPMPRLNVTVPHAKTLRAAPTQLQTPIKTTQTKTKNHISWF